MSNFPTAIDTASTLYSPVDAFSTKPLETTATGAIGAGDSTINVPSTMGGFAATYGILSIDDELIVYTAKTDTQFTGCQRGAFGTVAASHLTGVPVKANMVSGFITALQSAVLAVENELGTMAARNSGPETEPPRAWCACPTSARSSGARQTTPATSGWL